MSVVLPAYVGSGATKAVCNLQKDISLRMVLLNNYIYSIYNGLMNSAMPTWVVGLPVFMYSQNINHCLLCFLKPGTRIHFLKCN